MKERKTKIESGIKYGLKKIQKKQKLPTKEIGKEEKIIEIVRDD
jgi:hypothetical protein